MVWYNAIRRILQYCTTREDRKNIYGKYVYQGSKLFVALRSYLLPKCNLPINQTKRE